MNIDEMSQQEKSVVLLGFLPDFHVEKLVDGTHEVFDNSGIPLFVIRKKYNLYTTDENGDPHLMPMAWRVLNLAEGLAQSDTRSDFYSGWMVFLPEMLFTLKPAEAQAAWLDKILSLAIEAVMVE